MSHLFRRKKNMPRKIYFYKEEIIINNFYLKLIFICVRLKKYKNFRKSKNIAKVAY